MIVTPEVGYFDDVCMLHLRDPWFSSVILESYWVLPDYPATFRFPDNIGLILTFVSLRRFSVLASKSFDIGKLSPF